MTGPRSQRVESTVISECSMRQDHRTRCKPRRTRGPFSEPLASRVQLKAGFHPLPNERKQDLLFALAPGIGNASPLQMKATASNRPLTLGQT